MSAADIADLLNELLLIDRDCVSRLVGQRAACRHELVEHPTVLVNSAKGRYSLGLIGVLNGLTQREGQRLEPVYDAMSTELLYFRLVPLTEEPGHG